MRIPIRIRHTLSEHWHTHVSVFIETLAKDLSNNHEKLKTIFTQSVALQDEFFNWTKQELEKYELELKKCKATIKEQKDEIELLKRSKREDMAMKSDGQRAAKRKRKS